MNKKVILKKILCVMIVFLILFINCSCDKKVLNNNLVSDNKVVNSNYILHDTDQHDCHISVNEKYFELIKSIKTCKTIKKYDKDKRIEDIPTVKFGKYEQDNNLENGKEDIEWIVLDKVDKKKALLLSKYVLDIGVYDDKIKQNEISWENSDLYRWLNEDFMLDAFNIDECRYILPRDGKSTNSNNICYKVSILGFDEYDNYFGNIKYDGYNQRVAACATEYVLKKYEEYLIYDSDKREITYDDIVGFDNEKLKLALNEIYARHGRKFKNITINKYFSSKKWYKGIFEPDDFDLSKISDIEFKNIDFLNNQIKNITDINKVEEKEGNAIKSPVWYSNNFPFWIMDFNIIDKGIDGKKSKIRKNGFINKKGEFCVEKDNVVKSYGIRPMIWVDINNTNLYKYVVLGKYEQDNNIENGKEDIEWLILDSEYYDAGIKKLLLVSKNLLDVKQYNNENGYTKWESCSLRKWLNNDFFNESFTNYEKNQIICTENVDVDELNLGGKITEKTKDNVFLINSTELEKYFGSGHIRCDKSKTAEYTDYALYIAEGYEIDNKRISADKNKSDWKYRNGSYWQRDSFLMEGSVELHGGGYYDYYQADVVTYDGSIYKMHESTDYLGVRPAIWIYNNFYAKE